MALFSGQQGAMPRYDMQAMTQPGRSFATGMQNLAQSIERHQLDEEKKADKENERLAIKDYLISEGAPVDKADIWSKSKAIVPHALQSMGERDAQEKQLLANQLKREQQLADMASNREFIRGNIIEGREYTAKLKADVESKRLDQLAQANQERVGIQKRLNPEAYVGITEPANNQIIAFDRPDLSKPIQITDPAISSLEGREIVPDYKREAQKKSLNLPEIEGNRLDALSKATNEVKDLGNINLFNKRTGITRGSEAVENAVLDKDNAAKLKPEVLKQYDSVKKRIGEKSKSVEKLMEIVGGEVSKIYEASRSVNSVFESEDGKYIKVPKKLINDYSDLKKLQRNEAKLKSIVDVINYQDPAGPSKDNYMLPAEYGGYFEGDNQTQFNDGSSSYGGDVNLGGDPFVVNQERPTTREEASSQFTPEELASPAVQEELLKYPMSVDLKTQEAELRSKMADADSKERLARDGPKMGSEDKKMLHRGLVLEDALGQLEALEQGGFDPTNKRDQFSPNFFKSKEGKRYWSNVEGAILQALRSDSGAQIGDPEFDRYQKAYFPTYTDTPEIMADKRRQLNVIKDILTSGRFPLLGKQGELLGTTDYENKDKLYNKFQSSGSGSKRSTLLTE